jgi:hypothetical protein
METIRIMQDPSPSSPRSNENMGTMIAFHRNYNLGDKDHGFSTKDYNGWDEMEAGIRKEYGRDAVILPLYLYDHSGITMNTTGFSCRWDSGQVGFIVASLDSVRESYGIKRVTRKQRTRALEHLVAEVAEYAQYLEGDVYGFVLEDENGHPVDSCWGFYGSDPFKNGMADHFAPEQHEALKEAAKNIVDA